MSTVGQVNEPSDLLDLKGRRRAAVGVAGAALLVIGLGVLVFGKMDGLATSSVLVGALVLGLMAVVGQVPWSPWLSFPSQVRRFDELNDQFDAQASRLGDLETQLSTDAAFRSIASVASMNDARVEFWTKRGTPFYWPGFVESADGPGVAIAYVGAGDKIEDVIPAEVWRPPMSPAAPNILIVHEPGTDVDQIWHDVQASTQEWFRLFDNAAPGHAGGSVAYIATCVSSFTMIHKYLTALLRGDFGGTQHSNIWVSVLVPVEGETSSSPPKG